MLPNLDLDFNDGIQFDFELEEQPSRTFNIDFRNKRINGQIDGLDAVMQSVELIMMVERYKWLIYSWRYGVELQNLIGKDPGFVIAEVERRVTEALMQDDRIERVYNFEYEINSSELYFTINVDSIFGRFTYESKEVKFE